MCPRNLGIFYVLCFLTLHGHQESRNWLRTRFIMYSLPCINKFGTNPNCIFCFTCDCIHYAWPNSKCVSRVRTFSGLQKSICIMYLPHLLTCMVRLNNFVFLSTWANNKKTTYKKFLQLLHFTLWYLRYLPLHVVLYVTSYITTHPRPRPVNVEPEDGCNVYFFRADIHV